MSGTVLRATLVVGLALGGGAALAEDGGRAPAEASPVNPMQAVEKAKLRAFAQQPLFNPARALPAIAPAFYAPPMAAPPPQPPNLQLVGVIAGINAMAIIRDGGTTTMLHAGDHVGAWTVTILPTGLRLADGDRVFDYTLFNKGGSSTPSPGANGVPAALNTPLGGTPGPLVIMPHPDM